MKSSSKEEIHKDIVLVGRVSGAHGIRGVLKVQSYAESKALFQVGDDIQINQAGGTIRRMVISWVNFHGRRLLLGFDKVTDRNQAEALVGSTLYVDKSRLPPLAEDTYYWSDLLGLAVYDTKGSFLGHLEEVIPTPGNDVYVVKGDDKGQAGEILIPAIGDVVLRVDIEGKTMVVDPPKGL